ncbi:MAG: hypothetical protein M1522_02360 [Actinobacteria bacterium]|nr:hypothetical protein [Actinomycetota bacterium]
MTDIDLSTTDDPHGECRHHRGPHFLAPATEELELADLIDSLARLQGTVTLGLHRYGLCCQAVWLLMGNGMLWGEVPAGSLFNLAPEKARDGAIELTLHGWEQLSDEEGGQSFRLEASVPLHTGLVATAALVAVREALQANPNDIELYATWDPERAPAPPWEEHASDDESHGGHVLPIALLRVAPHLYPVHLQEVIGLLEKWYWSERPQLGMHA